MPGPIPPFGDVVVGSRFLKGRRGMAAAVIRPDGYPYSAEAQREVFEEARQLINESFRQRRIPTPPGGWTLVLVHPEERWQNHLAPALAAEITEELARFPAGAVVAVVLALDTAGEE
jgi:hypothetical protein